jgi:hypothetical protein
MSLTLTLTRGARGPCTRLTSYRLTAKLPNEMAVLNRSLVHTEWAGAGDGIRTRDIDLGKVALYQLSYSRLTGLLDILG